MVVSFQIFHLPGQRGEAAAVPVRSQFLHGALQPSWPALRPALYSGGHL